MRIKKGSKKLIIFLVVSIICLIGLAMFFIVKGILFNESSADELVADGFTDYFDVNSQVKDITAEFQTDSGYIGYENVDDAINAVGEYAKKKYDNKEIKDYKITNGCSVWIQFNSGVEYMYVPELEGCDSSSISTYQPCLKMYDTDMQSKSLGCVDGSAEDMNRTIEEYSFDNNYDNEEITLDLLKEIGKNKIVIWHGHGGYSTKTHSTLMTSLALDEDSFLLDPIYYISKIGYTDDYLSGRIVCSNSGYVMVTYKFFEKYLSNIESSIIYLGACSSGKDDVLANTLVSKGAVSVLANTDIIHTEYNLNMIESVFNELLKFSETDNRYNNLKDALKNAKAKCGKVCCNTYSSTEVKIWGDDDIRLTEDEIDIPNYTAKDLSEKTLSEIVEIMKGDFEVGYNDDKLVYYTSPSVHIYNYNVLPGFVFYIDGASEDYEKGQDIKANIKSGKYDSYTFLALLDDAKLTDEISANMTYNELTNIIGEFDCSGLAGADNYCYYTDIVGDQTIYMYKADDDLIKNYDGGEIKRDWLKNKNPVLNAIIVFPKSTTSNGTKNENSVTEKKTDDEWKNLYIDMINNDVDPIDFSLVCIDDDDIPELIFTGSAVSGTRVAWIKNGKVETQVIGYGKVQYYEKQGLFYCQYVNNGIYRDGVYSFTNKNLNAVIQGTILPEENGFENPGWFINNESVGKEEYEARLNNAFNFDNAANIDTHYSRDEIFDYINNY